MSAWRLVYDDKLKDLGCPYQVYCGDQKLPHVLIDGTKRDGKKIEFNVMCDPKRLSTRDACLTPDQIKKLPTDKIEFFNLGDDENPLECCRIYATLN